MDTYRDIESLFSDYFADDMEPVLRYASLQKADTTELEKRMASAWDQTMVREGSNGNKD